MLGKMLFGVVVALGMGVISVAQAGPGKPVLAYVTDAGTNPDGSVFVMFDRPVATCAGKPVTRFDLSNEHPAKNQVLLIGMTALAAFGSTKTYLAKCKEGVASFEPGESFFQLTKDKPVALKPQPPQQ